MIQLLQSWLFNSPTGGHLSPEKGVTYGFKRGHDLKNPPGCSRFGPLVELLVPETLPNLPRKWQTSFRFWEWMVIWIWSKHISRPNFPGQQKRIHTGLGPIKGAISVSSPWIVCSLVIWNLYPWMQTSLSWLLNRWGKKIRQHNSTKRWNNIRLCSFLEQKSWTY